MLLSCYEACKEFLDHFVERALAELPYITIIQITQLINTVILMVRLSQPLPAVEGWDHTAVRSIAKVEVYLNALARRACEKPDVTQTIPGMPETLFLWFRLMVEGLKKSLAMAGVLLEDQHPLHANERQDGDVGFAINTDVNGMSAETLDCAQAPRGGFFMDGIMDNVTFDDGFWGSFVWDLPGQPNGSMLPGHQ